jgi:glutamate carboxypeptidase
VGKISGGIGKNTVPDHAEALVDLRYVTQAENEKLRERILQAAGESAIPDTRIEVQWGPGRGPMEKTPASEALCTTYAECQKDSGLGFSEMPLVGGGSDAATTSSIGIPSIDGLGPRGSGFHTLDEYVELASLIPKSEALVRFLIKHGTPV